MNTKKISRHKLKLGLGIALLYAALPLFILNTNPAQLPLPLLLIPFLLLFASLFTALLFIGKKTRLLRGIDHRKQYAIAGLLTALPLSLFVFQSLHQLTIRDVIIAISLVFATGFYISRADFLR
jgi:hypothetical protein